MICRANQWTRFYMIRNDLVLGCFSLLTFKAQSKV